jgi:hypothetical protein
VIHNDTRLTKRQMYISCFFNSPCSPLPKISPNNRECCVVSNSVPVDTTQHHLRTESLSILSSKNQIRHESNLLTCILRATLHVRAFCLSPHSVFLLFFRSSDSDYIPTELQTFGIVTCYEKSYFSVMI